VKLCVKCGIDPAAKKRRVCYECRKKQIRDAQRAKRERNPEAHKAYCREKMREYMARKAACDKSPLGTGPTPNDPPIVRHACGLEYDAEVCPLRKKAAIKRARQCLKVQIPECLTCEATK